MLLNPKFKKTGFYPADILIPRDCDMTKWSVVACDQYTSQPEYWENAAHIVGGSPSTLRLILPEVYLNDGVGQRIDGINANMRGYLDSGMFRTVRDGFVYVERQLTAGRVRRGLVGVIDLENYDFHKGSGSMIRATEGTVLERIPPRMRVRKDAPLEVPHVMLLIDDPGRTVIEPVTQLKDKLEKLYDFELMCGGGHITGYAVTGDMLDGIAGALAHFTSPDTFRQKYGQGSGPVMAFAVGDGNHSLATAKQCWEQVKALLTPEQAQSHPARFALVELVNIHDDSLEFEPIHRVVFGVEPQKLVKALYEYYPSAGQPDATGPKVDYLYAGGSGTVHFGQEGLAVGLLQAFLDDYTGKHGGSVDYIHGDDVVKSLSQKDGAVGFLLPPMGKSELFRSVIRDGALPRKTFSMGSAQEKRFYLECRKIQ